MNTSSEVSPATEAIAWNVDLLTQILVCLPAKSLIRFKSVSKQWRSLISDSQFATKHHRQNPRLLISGVFLCREDYSFKSFKCVSLQGDPTGPSLDYILKQTGSMYGTRIIGSCNGLLLCEYWQVIGINDPHHYFVCNPTTQMCKLIPEPSERFVSAWKRALFAFDPSKSPHYKVMILGRYPCHSGKKPYIQIDIYSSKSASWKQHLVRHKSIANPVFCNGVIYWLYHGNVISGFDVDSEKLIKKKLPLKVHHVKLINYFGECNGRLILIQNEGPFDMEFDILETDDDYSHWIVKYRVNLEPLQLVFHHLGIFPRYSVKSVLNGEEKDFALLLAFPGKTVYYKLKCNTWNVLHDVPGDPPLTAGFHYSMTACSFIQTLHRI